MTYSASMPSFSSSPSTSWQALPPSDSHLDALVPRQFKDAVFLHVVKNQIASLSSCPLMLAIQGPMGQGKSFMTRAACSQLGFYVVPVSGALLGGSHESAAVKVLESAYVYASAVVEHRNVMTVLLIDDFDLSVASAFEERKYTVNSQLLSGFLMNLADDPQRCGQYATARVPIILTGNNFQQLHAPLTRHGRMRFFEWKPTIEDRITIVQQMLMPLLRREEVGRVAQLVRSFPDEPIAFFSALRDDLSDYAILDCVRAEGRVDIGRITLAVERALQKCTASALHDIAQRRVAARAVNYIEPSGDSCVR